MIKQNKLSLTKKLDGGYIHVKKNGAVATGHNTLVTKGGYSEYLNKKGGSKGSKDSKGKRGSNVTTSNKVISVKLTPTKKTKSPKKVKKKINDIPDISIVHSTKPKSVLPKSVLPKSVLPKSVLPKSVNIPLTPARQLKQQKVLLRSNSKGSHSKGSHSKGRHSKGSHSKGSHSKGGHSKGSHSKGRHSKGRRLNKSLTRRRLNDIKQGKKVSVTKTRKYSDKEIVTIQQKLKEIKDKPSKQIKDELEQQGIKLSGKSPSIMKDIYMYSQLCGINIKRE